VGFIRIGSEAGEVLAVIQTAMLTELASTKLRDAVVSHLTMAEGLGPLSESIPSRSD
jgi:pyruvate/2-oxoglutarate dehydrogenase complex dihydrolipoamide dehydrogenase (E3) component